MSERSIETTGENVEEAIAKGLAELGASPTQVIVEVLEEPSRGVFGIGARPARVRLQLLSVPQPLPPASAPPEVPPIPALEREERREPRQERERPPRQPRLQAQRMDIDVPEDEDADATSLFQESYETVPEGEMDEEAQVGQVVLNELLERMFFRNVQVVVKRALPSRPGESAPYILDVTGTGDLTRLIGRRGDTLAALQYVARLITSRELQRRANIIVDIDGYKARRARMLRSLANRMADQAIESARTVQLEPMPPHERRIIHLALRERDDVSTRSIGEGAGRKVTIVPNNEGPL